MGHGHGLQRKMEAYRGQSVEISLANQLGCGLGDQRPERTSNTSFSVFHQHSSPESRLQCERAKLKRIYIEETFVNRKKTTLAFGPVSITIFNFHGFEGVVFRIH